MTVIKKIDQETADAYLREEEGDLLPQFYLTAVQFMPPRPLTEAEQDKIAEVIDPDDDESEGVAAAFNMQHEYKYRYVLLIEKAEEPMYFEQLSGERTFILPGARSEQDEHGNFTYPKINYEMLSAIHWDQHAYAYRIEPKWWNAWDIDGDDQMNAAHWFFKPNAQKPWTGKEDTNR